MSTERNYGSWTSPISPELCIKESITYNYICQDQCNDIKSTTVYWVELRSTENGRCVIMSRDIANEKSESVQWTPESYSARTKVHEYGGAEMFVHNGLVYFSNESDQHLYKQERAQCKPTLVIGTKDCRFANGFFSTILNTIFIVREQHIDGRTIIALVSIKDGTDSVLMDDKDFYSSPRISEDGDRLCWVEWKFPNMPWDNTHVCTARYDDKTMKIIPESIEKYCNNPDSDPISCMVPMWTKHNSLLYTKDETGFWNVWLAKSVNEQTNLTPVDEDIGEPMWEFDIRKYNYSGIIDRIVVVRKEGQLEWMNVDGSDPKIVYFQSALNYMSHPQLMPDGSVVVIGSSPSTKRTIYHLSMDGTHTIVGQTPYVAGIDPKFISIPRLIKYPVQSSFSYGYYYAPCNPNYHGLKGTLPPLMIKVHGGPTSSTSTDLNFKIQYLTSRGFAVFDVDYRGSTGYGKQYRQLLNGNWGVRDIEDCSEGVKYLIKENLVDENKVVISGGSAGGYTVLCCLTFTNVFKAGCSLYGIGDLKTLLEDTHNFQSRYLDILIGKYDESPDLYRIRSPSNFPGRIKCPMIFFQGDQDRVVPQEQSIKMFESIKAASIPCALVIYPGEAHGFRKMENIIHQLEGEYYFYSKIFQFETPDIANPSITIENL